MKLLASLTNRIFIAASLLAIVTTGVAVYVVGLRATREAELELARGLAEAGDLVDQQQRALTAQSLLTARLLADLPKLKGAVETRHAETVAPIAADYRRQVAADLLVISDKAGARLAAVPTGAGAPTPEAVTAALGGREVVEFRPDAGGVLQVATVPIAIGLESPDVLGTVSVGVRLDAQMAERFKRATRSEVAFTLDGTVRAATVPQSTWPALQPLLSQPAVSQILIGDSEYVGRAQPLGASESGEVARLRAPPCRERWCCNRAPSGSDSCAPSTPRWRWRPQPPCCWPSGSATPSPAPSPVRWPPSRRRCARWRPPAT